MAIIRNSECGVRAYKRCTEGSKLVAWDAAGETDDHQLVPYRKVTIDENGEEHVSEYVFMLFEDETRYCISVKALNFFTCPEIDGKPNPAFLEQGIMIGMEFRAMRGEKGRPILEYV